MTSKIISALHLDVISILKRPDFVEESNLIEQYSLVTDLFKSVEEKHRLEPIADSIVDIFLASQHDVALKYLKLCVPYCSSSRIDRIFENLSSLLIETVSEVQVKLVGFVMSYLDIVVKSGRVDFQSSPIHRGRAESLIQSGMELVRSDEKLFNKLGIAILEKMAGLDCFRSQVLSHCLQLVSATQTEQHGNDRKKRVESHVNVIELSLITSLAEEIFRRVDDEECAYLDKSVFWALVQQGLVHPNQLTRRQALYLLKRANDSAAHIDKECVRLRLSQMFGTETIYFYRPDWVVWNDFFLCIEVLEETSVNKIQLNAY